VEPALDRHLPRFQVNEVHEIAIAGPPEQALERALAVPAGCDPLVRLLFRLRGVPGAELPLARFASEALRLELVERTATSAVFTGRLRGLAIGFAFEAEPGRLVTETRVGNVGRRFRLYWLVVGPFSALIRRRWLATASRSTRATVRDHGA
jgi:hypothetical protein